MNISLNPKGERNFLMILAFKKGTLKTDIIDLDNGIFIYKSNKSFSDGRDIEVSKTILSMIELHNIKKIVFEKTAESEELRTSLKGNLATQKIMSDKVKGIDFQGDVVFKDSVTLEK